jgi:hypothetical protein
LITEFKFIDLLFSALPGKFISLLYRKLKMKRGTILSSLKGGGKSGKKPNLLKAEEQIRDTYCIEESNGEKKEAIEAMAARTLENTAECNTVHSWSENDLQEFKLSVEIISGGTNTVLVDDWGIPSVMARFPMLTNRQLLQYGSDNAHPAFMIREQPQKALYVSKFQNILIGGRGYSLPLKDPACGVTFDAAVNACRTKGYGWHLFSFALRAALVLWTWKNGFLPRGNSDDGCNFFYRNEKGIPTAGGRVATGSGPVTWTHNKNWNGIYDLTGNVNEWNAGLRLVDGEIQIIPGDNCALPECDMSENSCEWRAILPDGSLAEPGSRDSLKYDYRNGKILITTRIDRNTEKICNCSFGDIQIEEGLKIPEIIYSLILCPEIPQGDYDGWRWISTKGERLPLCGGAHRALDHAGVFFIGLTYPRTMDYELAGFRSACILNE